MYHCNKFYFVKQAILIGTRYHPLESTCITTHPDGPLRLRLKWAIVLMSPCSHRHKENQQQTCSMGPGTHSRLRLQTDLTTLMQRRPLVTNKSFSGTLLQKNCGKKTSLEKWQVTKVAFFEHVKFEPRLVLQGSQKLFKLSTSVSISRPIFNHFQACRDDKVSFV